MDGLIGMLRFQWVLRPSDSIELNLMLTPSCATFTRGRFTDIYSFLYPLSLPLPLSFLNSLNMYVMVVTESKDGRVYVMKMQGGGAKR
jgi:hypothetical protein